ncbi:MAG: hypothetical protein AB7N76_22875 [Planctomycetota bacterium]
MSKAAWAGPLLLLCLTGCTNDGPQTKTVEITQSRKAAPSKPARPLGSAARFGFGGGGGMPPAQQAPEENVRVDLAWHAPSSWKELGPNAMRLVTFDLGQGAECYVVRLPGQAGGVAANVNRWRKQMGQPPLSSEELAALPQQVALGVTGILAELSGTFSGMGGEAREGYKMLGLILVYRGYTIFVKLTGPAAVVDDNRGGFLSFCRSLHDTAAGGAPHAHEHEAPAPTPSDPGPVGPAPPAADGGLRWTKPAGWEDEQQPRAMRVVTFRVPVEGSPQAECYVSALAGPAGGVEANLQRWRGQLGLEPLDAAGLAALPRVEVLGQRVAVLEAVGAYTGMNGPAQGGTYLIGAVVPSAEQTYFVKLIAPGAGKPVQRDAFLAFLQSLRIER